MYRYKVSENGFTVYRDGELRSLAAIGKHEWQATLEDKEGKPYLTVRQCATGVTVEEHVKPL